MWQFELDNTKERPLSQTFTRSKKINRIWRSLKVCETMHFVRIWVHWLIRIWLEARFFLNNRLCIKIYPSAALTLARPGHACAHGAVVPDCKKLGLSRRHREVRRNRTLWDLDIYVLFLYSSFFVLICMPQRRIKMFLKL